MSNVYELPKQLFGSTSEQDFSTRPPRNWRSKIPSCDYRSQVIAEDQYKPVIGLKSADFGHFALAPSPATSGPHQIGKVCGNCQAGQQGACLS
jgi:hypothetical protein